MGKSKTATDWAKRHASAEKALTKVLSDYFTGQQKRIMAAVKDHQTITVATVAQVFKPADEHKRLMEAIRDPMRRIMAAGAVVVQSAADRALAKAKKPKGKKSDLEDFRLPDDVRAAIDTAWQELEEQPYWAAIQSTTSDRLTNLISTAIDEGLNGYDMAKRINESLGGLADVRSRAIARTETTGAFNSGHAAVYDQLAADGEAAFQVEWSSTLDGDTRPTHSALDGVRIDPGQTFILGGHSTPFPGHHSLPAGERVNCRCTTIAAFEIE